MMGGSDLIETTSERFRVVVAVLKVAIRARPSAPGCSCRTRVKSQLRGGC